MRLHFIRHAQSGNNALYTRTGSWHGRESDPELTELGHIQAVHLAKYAGESLTDTAHIYCSLMVRAVQTASYVSKALEMPLTAWAEVHEKSGVFERHEVTKVETPLPGHPRSYYEKRFPHLILPDSLGEEGWWNQPSETWEMAKARGALMIETLLAQHGNTDDTVAVVSHAGFYQGFMRALLQLPESMWQMRFELDNTGITTIEFMDDITLIKRNNDTRFLSADFFSEHTKVTL